MEKLTGSMCKSLIEAYNAVYDTDIRTKLEEEKEINEFNNFINFLIDEGYDLSECTYEDLYEYYINEGWKEKLGQYALKTATKYGGKALELGKKGLKAVGEIPVTGAKTIVKGALAPLRTKVGSTLATLGALEAGLAGEKSKVRQGASWVAQQGQKGIETVYGNNSSQQKPATAQTKPSTPKPYNPTREREELKVVQGGKAGFVSKMPKPTAQTGETAQALQARTAKWEKSQALAKKLTQQVKDKQTPSPATPDASTTSKLYEKAQEPLTVSGGRTGTGVGKGFKARPWTQAEVQRYKQTRGAEQIETDIQLNKDVAAMNRQIAATPKGQDPEFYRPPASRPATTKPAPTRPAPAAQTGDRTKDLTTWAKSNERMISGFGTPQQRAILSAAKSGSAMPAPRPISKDVQDLKDLGQKLKTDMSTGTGPQAKSSLPGGDYSPAATAKMTQRTRNILGTTKEAYDIVLDYLLSQGHVDTLEEALYVMMEMDSENIKSIVEGVMPEPINPDAHKEAQRLARQQGRIRALEAGASTPGEQSAAKSKLRGPQLPGV